MARRNAALILALFCLLAGTLAGCFTPQPTPEPSATPTPSATLALTPTQPPTKTITPSPTFDPQRPWGRFAGPNQTPVVTQVPAPFEALFRPAEVRVLVLMGTDTNAPYAARTDAIQLILYHPRLARASLISLPPDLMVYIPGVTMQRLQIAYALGGWFGLAETIQYNFGIRPNAYVLVHLDEFVRFVDKHLGGLDVPVVKAYADPKLCGGIPAGTYHMSGDQLLCYIRFRVGSDEADRNRRQQEVFRLVLLRMVQSGNLANLPELFKAFHASIETNLELNDLLDAIPLVLKLGDPNRMNYYHFDTEELETWKLPEKLSPSVFLPKRSVMQPVLQNAMNFIQTPAPLSEVVKTYEAALTFVPSTTNTRPVTITPTRTNTLQASRTPTPTLLRTATRTLTPSQTFTPSPTGPTPTPTITPTGPTPTNTLTPEGYPNVTITATSG
jgi:polyisoprenyl-teichoic acid--peptidoglycan teichoic acid transferase